MRNWAKSQIGRLKGWSALKAASLAEFPFHRIIIFVMMITVIVLGGILFLNASEEAARLLARPEADAGDKLSFYGSVLGAGGTAMVAILGVVVVEELRRAGQEREELQIVRDALTKLRNTMAEIQNAVRGDFDDLAAHRNQILAVLEEVGDALALLDLVVSTMRLRRFRHMQAMYLIRRTLTHASKTFERETHIVQGHRATIGIIQTYYSNAQPTAAELVPALDTALRALRW